MSFPLIGVLLAMTSLAAADASASSSQTSQAFTDPLSAFLSPISINPDQNWDGIAGQWSSFTLRVGTPPQFVRTFVSFSVYQTWVVLSQGCDGAADPSSCAFNRGGLVQQNQSTTFTQKGLFDLDPEKYLGYGGNAIFGYDTVGLGGLGDGGPTLNDTIVGGFASEYYYLGVLGLNPKSTNFTTFDQPSTSYMTLLSQRNLIPSVSAAYTAGAPYAFGGAGQLASLTLGGYDAARFVPNDVEFIFGVDNSRDLLVSIQAISSDHNGTTQLLPSPINAIIDTTVPEIWLPQQACTAFESAFGLVWDNQTALYLLNDTQHQSLKKQNASVTFSLAQALQGGPSVDIRLPYAAFDLLAKSPYQRLQNDTHYFPLKRAVNDTQYVLGRTFLQEAYLSVNWDTQRFNVSQVNWQQHAPKQIIAMQGLNYSDDSEPSNVVTSGAIGGIIIGVLVLIAVVAGGLYYNVLRRRRRAKLRQLRKVEGDNASAAMSNVSRNGDSPGLADTTVFPKAELEGSIQFGRAFYGPKRTTRSHTLASCSTVEPQTGTVSRTGSNSVHSPTSPFGEGTYSTITGTYESHHTDTSTELHATDSVVYEMPGDDLPTIVEKDSRSLSEKEALHRREQVYNGVTPPPTATSESFPLAAHQPPPLPPPRRPSVNPDDVVPVVGPTGRSFSTTSRHHRHQVLTRPRTASSANSQTGTTWSSFAVSPTTPAPPYSVSGDALPPLPALPEGPPPALGGVSRKRFSFEEEVDGEEEMEAVPGLMDEGRGTSELYE